MKIELPKSWFARILLGGWALFFIGVFLFFLLSLVTSSRLAGHLIVPLLILSTLVAVGTFAYGAAYTTGRLLYYFGGPWRRTDGNQAPVALRRVERILVVGWMVFIAAALGALLFSHGKWVLAYGPEVLFSLFCVVPLSSVTYGSYLLLRRAMKHPRRG
jgi:hypothetical protein